ERSDAAESPTATLARDRARPLSAQRSPSPTGPPAGAPGAPSARPAPSGERVAHTPGAPGPAGSRSGAHREGAVSAPAATSTPEAAERQQPAPGVPPPRPPAAGQRPGLVPQLVLALVCAAYAVGAALGWGSDRLALIMGDFGLSAAAGAAAVSCFVCARRRRTRFRPAWLLFGLSSTMAALGNLVWGWYEVVLDRPVPSPSYADLFFLCFAPPAIVGLLVLAKRPVTKAGWICLALDASLIGGSLLTLAWSLALAQAAQAEGESVAHTALSLAYPLLDIALVSLVLALHFRRSAVNRSAVNTA